MRKLLIAVLATLCGVAYGEWIQDDDVYDGVEYRASYTWGIERGYTFDLTCYQLSCWFTLYRSGGRFESEEVMISVQSLTEPTIYFHRMLFPDISESKRSLFLNDRDSHYEDLLALLNDDDAHIMNVRIDGYEERFNIRGVQEELRRVGFFNDRTSNPSTETVPSTSATFTEYAGRHAGDSIYLTVTGSIGDNERVNIYLQYGDAEFEFPCTLSAVRDDHFCQTRDMSLDFWDDRRVYIEADFGTVILNEIRS